MYDDNNNIFSILVFGYEVTEQVVAKNNILQMQQQHTKELEEKVLQRTFELSKANELMQQKNEELIKVNKELESFTYVSSHDLQEPLRKIQSFANRIMEKENQNLSVTGKDYFSRMQSAAERMQRLIEDLLAYSRINSNERKFEITDLNKIVEDVKAELRDTIETKYATIEATHLCEANIIPFQFRQLMLNLIGNALKFSKPETLPHIVIKSRIEKVSKINNENTSVHLEHLSPEKYYCHISVSDNGIGFEPHFSDRIFEVFQKLHSKQEYPGTGIGLAIVKKIVDNHNGFISAASQLNVGTTFDIYILAN